MASEQYYLNPTENLWWKLKRKKVSATIEDLLIAIRENWRHFDKEYCFKLVKPLLEKIMLLKSFEERKLSIDFFNEFPNIFPQ